MPDTEEDGGRADSGKASGARRLLTESLLFSLVPIVGYSLAYKYEQGVCDYFCVPTEVIDLSLWSVVGFSLALFGALVGALFLMNALGIIIINNPLWPRVGRLHPSIRLKWGIATMLVGPHLYFGTWGLRLLSLSVVAFLAIIDFVIPILVRGAKSRLDSINEAEEKDIQALARPLEYLPKRLLWLPLALLVTWNVLNCASLAGNDSASNSKTFRCIELDSREYAILRIYGDVAYCAEVESHEKRLTGRYRAVPMAGQTWESREIGPLKPPSKVD